MNSNITVLGGQYKYSNSATANSLFARLFFSLSPPRLIKLYWFNGLLLLLFCISFDLYSKRREILSYAIIFASELYTLSSFICRFKKHVKKWDTFMASSFCDNTLKGSRSVPCFISSCVPNLSLCNVRRIQNWKLLLPLCIFLTSTIHYKFKQWCWFLLESEQKMVTSPSGRNFAVLKSLGNFN